MPQSNLAWQFEHSVQCAVSPKIAWNFWTDVRNWALDADVESVEIDGPFATGARGCTHSKSSGRIDWSLIEVQSGRAVIELPLPGAIARVFWSFADSRGGTTITQRWTLEGEQAAAYATTFGPALETGIPAGMQKLSTAIENSSRATPVSR